MPEVGFKKALYRFQVLILPSFLLVIFTQIKKQLQRSCLSCCVCAGFVIQKHELFHGVPQGRLAHREECKLFVKEKAL